tara:strand:- start:696 stop:1223 length:528 start_codon:yes stop_codon:yes gene_type:complete
MSNLRLINETTVGTDVFSVNVEDVFSTDFDIYKVTIFGLERTQGSTQTRIHMRYINNSGSVVTGSTYEYATYRLKSDTSFTEANSTGTTYQQYGQIDEYPEGAGLVAYIFNPNNSSSYTFQLWQMMSAYNSVSIAYKGIGFEQTEASYTGFQILEVSGREFSSGTIRTYGLRVDS